jgi:phospholipid-translocating ATPase
MNNAFIRFFPESGDPSISSNFKGTDGQTIPLQRINTGVSLVGVDNGERPGGFVLVVDGAALLEVWCLFVLVA